MATKYDMPTNEGTLALARAVASGAKLVIKGAALCKVESGTSMASVAAVADLKWSDLVNTQVMSTLMPCSSYLPSMYECVDSAPERSMAALDIEFNYAPMESVTYNVVAVLADLYYAITPFKAGKGYSVGDVVWLTETDGSIGNYRCTKNVESGVDPRIDTGKWSPVTLVSTMDERYGGLEYATISADPVLLYVSKSSGLITIDQHMEIDYKVRLYLDKVQDASEIKDYVVFDTLGPEFMGSSMLTLLAYVSKQMQAVRSVALEKASRS